MSMRTLVNTTKMWDAFVDNRNKEITTIHKMMEISPDWNTTLKLQGRIRQLRDDLNLRKTLNAESNKDG